MDGSLVNIRLLSYWRYFSTQFHPEISKGAAKAPGPEALVVMFAPVVEVFALAQHWQGFAVSSCCFKRTNLWTFSFLR